MQVIYKIKIYNVLATMKYRGHIQEFLVEINGEGYWISASVCDLI